MRERARTREREKPTYVLEQGEVAADDGEEALEAAEHGREAALVLAGDEGPELGGGAALLQPLADVQRLAEALG